MMSSGDLEDRSKIGLADIRCGGRSAASPRNCIASAIVFKCRYHFRTMYFWECEVLISVRTDPRSGYIPLN